MIIAKKRIKSVDKYLVSEQSINSVYVSIPSNEKVINILKKKCEIQQYDIGRRIVPISSGPITEFNLNGKEVVYKDKEKENRVIERTYHIIDWNGKDHYGICYQTRKCYPRGIINPPLEEIIFDIKMIRSELISALDKDRLKHIINMFLEIFGSCELLNENENSITKNIKVKSLDWEILPPGRYPWDKAKNILKTFLEKVPEKNKNVLENRHKFFSNHNPDFLAIGKDSFNGYVVYGYSDKDLYVFESNQINNATYIFKGKWEDASKLSKIDVINGKLCYKRLIHTKSWEVEIGKIFNMNIT